jgi:hypothetical protein
MGDFSEPAKNLSLFAHFLNPSESFLRIGSPREAVNYPKNAF